MIRFLTRHWFFSLLLCLLPFTTWLGWRLVQEKPPEQRYKLESIVRGELRQSVSANGTLNPVTLVNVGTQVSGTVKKLHVDFNSKVTQGQVLLELDDALLSAQVRQSAANMQSAQAAVDLAYANHQRASSLFEQEYISRQEFDQTLQALKSAQAQLALVRAQNDRDRANLAYATIRSPVSGVIIARNIDVGQTVAASFQTPTLFQIAQDLSRMQIDSSFAEADIGHIRVGQHVKFTVDAFPNRDFKGEVRQIRLNPANQQNVVTYNVVISVENPELILLPGMTSYVTIVVHTRESVLMVPNAALRFKPADLDKPRDAAGPGNMNGEKKSRKKRETSSGTVYVLQQGQLKPITLQLGITDNRSTEVLEGDLREGDQVIVGEHIKEGGEKSSGKRSPQIRMF